MNIFVTDDDPIASAHNLCDQHVKSKMQIEGAIMLAHAFTQETLNHESTPRTKLGKARKRGKGYFNHQCSIWARESLENFEWLVEHTLEMFNERRLRLPGSKDHFTESFIKWCRSNKHNTIISQRSMTPYAIAINADSNCCKIPNFKSLTTIDKYREFIIHDKEFATWSVRNTPSWYKNS